MATESGGQGGASRERQEAADGAVVVTVTVTLVGVLPGVSGLGEIEHVASDGAPEQAKLIAVAIPPCPPTLSVYVAAEPRVTEAVVAPPDGGAKVKSCPVPLSAKLCGLPCALSLKVRLPDASPMEVGEKVTATVQVEPAATALAVVHVVPDAEIANGAGALIALKPRLALPVFFSVTASAALLVPVNVAGKESVAGVSIATAPVPVPERVTNCGLPAALSVTLSEALRAPVPDGVKVTLTEHVPLGATVAPVQVS
jgi:hypothetical protein